jgi:hypothetical protein
MAEEFEYVSHARLEFRDGYRRAFLGEVSEPVVYGVQGKLREYYGAKEGPPRGCRARPACAGRARAWLSRSPECEGRDPDHLGRHAPNG